MKNIINKVSALCKNMSAMGLDKDAEALKSMAEECFGKDSLKISLAQSMSPDNIGVSGVNNLIDVVNEKTISRFCYNFYNGDFKPFSQWQTLKEDSMFPWVVLIVSGPASFYADKKISYIVRSGNGYYFPGSIKKLQKSVVTETGEKSKKQYVCSPSTKFVYAKVEKASKFFEDQKSRELLTKIIDGGIIGIVYGNQLQSVFASHSINKKRKVIIGNKFFKYKRQMGRRLANIYSLRVLESDPCVGGSRDAIRYEEEPGELEYPERTGLVGEKEPGINQRRVTIEGRPPEEPDDVQDIDDPRIQVRREEEPGALEYPERTGLVGEKEPGINQRRVTIEGRPPEISEEEQAAQISDGEVLSDSNKVYIKYGDSFQTSEFFGNYAVIGNDQAIGSVFEKVAKKASKNNAYNEYFGFQKKMQELATKKFILVRNEEESNLGGLADLGQPGNFLGDEDDFYEETYGNPSDPGLAGSGPSGSRRRKNNVSGNQPKKDNVIPNDREILIEAISIAQDKEPEEYEGLSLEELQIAYYKNISRSRGSVGIGAYERGTGEGLSESPGVKGKIRSRIVSNTGPIFSPPPEKITEREDLLSYLDNRKLSKKIPIVYALKEMKSKNLPSYDFVVSQNIKDKDSLNYGIIKEYEDKYKEHFTGFKKYYEEFFQEGVNPDGTFSSSGYQLPLKPEIFKGMIAKMYFDGIDQRNLSKVFSQEELTDLRSASEKYERYLEDQKKAIREDDKQISDRMFDRIRESDSENEEGIVSRNSYRKRGLVKSADAAEADYRTYEIYVSGFDAKGSNRNAYNAKYYDKIRLVVGPENSPKAFDSVSEEGLYSKYESNISGAAELIGDIAREYAHIGTFTNIQELIELISQIPR